MPVLMLVLAALLNVAPVLGFALPSATPLDVMPISASNADYHPPTPEECEAIGTAAAVVLAIAQAACAEDENSQDCSDLAATAARAAAAYLSLCGDVGPPKSPIPEPHNPSIA